ncbi:MAG: hypothetical protein BalsKO_25550 [Balneolaceae bacterium]
MSMLRFKLLSYFCLVLLLLSACRSTKPSVETTVLPVSTEEYSEVISKLPNYTNALHSISGKGRAIVSETGNSDRVTIEFETDSVLSLLTIKNRIGIVGGVMLVDEDSILIYNKVDKIAQKMASSNGRRTSLNELASINLLDLLNYKIEVGEVESMERHSGSELNTFIILKTGGYARISEKNGEIEYIEQPRSTGLPYSAIRYENYGKIDGFTLPRKITILSADEASKVVFQVRSLTVNPTSLKLNIQIPDDIPIQRI